MGWVLHGPILSAPTCIFLCRHAGAVPPRQLWARGALAPAPAYASLVCTTDSQADGGCTLPMHSRCMRNRRRRSPSRVRTLRRISGCLPPSHCRLLESVGSQYRSSLRGCLHTYLRLNPQAAVLEGALRRRMVDIQAQVVRLRAAGTSMAGNGWVGTPC